MIKAVIYDLDNCLFSAKDIPVETFMPVLKAIRKSNFVSGTLDEKTLNAYSMNVGGLLLMKLR